MNALHARAWLLMLSLLLPLLPAAGDEPVPPGALWMMKLDGVVGPSSADYLVRGIERAGESGAAAVLLRIDTPGGLDSAMREMVSAVLAAPLPVICHVAPSGARAASAGTFLLYACHVAAMAPATNLGAATPVSIGTPLTPSPGDVAPSGEEQDKSEAESASGSAKSPMERKITNDAVAYIRGLAELRGRNAEWAEQAVREGASLSASAALEQGVIDLVAADAESLLKALTGKKVQVGSREFTLDLAGAPRITHDPDWRSEFLAVITNPNVAYVLMLIGLYGLIYEFANPGFGLPGVLGLTCLLVALYAFQILPVSYAGLGLMLLGVGLIAAEVMMPSFGIFGIGGLIAFVVGSIMLMDTEIPAYQIAMPVIAALSLMTGLLLFAILGMAMRAHRRPRVFDTATSVGHSVLIEQVNPDQVLARYDGELWSVRCDAPLSVGDRVRIRKLDGLTLVVDKEED